MALVIAGAGALLASTASDSDPSAKVLGGNPPVNAGAGDRLDLSAHNSPTVVQSPVASGELAVANRIDTPRFSCALHFSSDGGASWRQLTIPAPEGEEPKCYAADVAFGADGTLYLSFSTLKGRGNVPNAVWLASMPRGGRVLSRPRRVLGRFAFQARLIADPAAPRRLYLSWLEASGVGLLRFDRPGNPIRRNQASATRGPCCTVPACLCGADPGRLRDALRRQAVGEAAMGDATRFGMRSRNQPRSPR